MQMPSKYLQYTFTFANSLIIFLFLYLFFYCVVEILSCDFVKVCLNQIPAKAVNFIRHFLITRITLNLFEELDINVIINHADCLGILCYFCLEISRHLA